MKLYRTIPVIALVAAPIWSVIALAETISNNQQIAQQAAPQFEEIETIPPSPTKRFESLSNGSPKSQANQIESGLKQATRSGEIGKYSSAGLAVQRMLQRMRWGESAEFASVQAGVPQATVLRLLDLGTEKPLQEDPRSIANAIVRGLSVANATGEIGYTAAMSYRVQDIVRRLRRGNNLETAMRYSRVPQKTVNRLLELGNYKAEL